jgi:alpha-galactosidase
MYKDIKPRLIITALITCVLQIQAKPLKVFILAGQSNMEGQAEVRTFDYIGEDPTTAPLLKQMVGPDGKPRTCERVWISYLTGNGTVKQGKLTAGYGALGGAPKIGPEFTFGLTLEKVYDGPILIIKTAWGGKSLNTDFRPPSAGPYELNDFQNKFYYGPPAHGRPADMEQWLADKKRDTGLCYRQMIEHVRNVLKDPKAVCPEYDSDKGYEIAGFVWLQGWNDMCDNHTYPKGHEPGGYALYSELLASFIRDVRKDLSVPKMPFVIGVMGVGGVEEKPSPFRQAMAAPAELPEFKGTVVAVQTGPFWDKKLGEIDSNNAKISQMNWLIDTKNKGGPNEDGKMTEEQKKQYMKDFRTKLIPPEDEALWKRGASNAGYHYLGCAKTFALMGKAFAEACNNVSR